MLSYQPSFFAPTEELTSARFSQMIVSDGVVKNIATVRQLKEQAREAASRGEDPRPLEQQAQQLKRKLPAVCWQATFDETLSARGNRGRWRKQSAARLNGLFMMDIDHVDDPAEMFSRWTKSPGLLDALGILLVHITPSGHGLRLVAKAQMDGNLIDNQLRLASQLGVACDEACKDASRLSYCPGFEDILFSNFDQLFSYDNKDYDAKWGPAYRQGHSAPSAGPRGGSSRGADAAAGGAHVGDGEQPGVAAPHGEAHVAQPLRIGSAFPDSYYGVKYEDIITAWFRLNNGGVEPDTGDRHRVLLRLAGDLRYMCNNKEDFLRSAMERHAMVRRYGEEDGADLTNICRSVCEKQLWSGIPRRVAAVLQDRGVELPAAAAGAGAGLAGPPDYEAYWHRLQPLLNGCPLLADAVADLPERHRLAGVLAAGAMLGTYLSRTWWEHFDGKFYRLSFLVYIIGSAASGKSFITQLDKLLLAPLKSADRVGREAERKYTELTRKRKANEQLPDRPHPVVRYCPSSTSNAIFYRRLQDAVDSAVTDPDTQEPLHLHLITVESEIATALRAQVGSWAGKLDLELKSFHNEVAGVDFANADSTNGPMQINWNQVMSGTLESMSRKIQPRNVLDGLVTRLVLFPMPANDYQMLERRHALRDHERECRLRSVGYDLERVSGELHVPRLVDFCYAYEEELTRRAALEEDRCLDYFRKRVPVIMMRYALVRLVLRQLSAAKKGEDLEVSDDDLEFARLIGDWCLEAQVYMFGQMVLDALDAEAQAFKPRGMQAATRAKFERLPRRFTLADMVKAGFTHSTNGASSTVARWEKAGIIRKLERGKYEKATEKS